LVEDLCLDEKARIVTSLDGPFAISDAIRNTIGTAQKYLLISAPWLSKGFVDSLRNFSNNGILINTLTRMPEKTDYSFHAVDSMVNIADFEGWKVNVKCNPYVHAKFIVVDGKTCVFGTSNPTDSGIYYNHEILVILKHPVYVDKISEFFQKVWERPENISFEQVKRFHGYKTIDNRTIRKEIAERIVGIFIGNGNSKIPKWKVSKEVQKFGYSENEVISVAKDLVNDGVLYEPDFNSYRMVSAE
jgi:phosphatidylserine/phosphatidylglycerophosphate/cardiolipin synthase-like enzyme